MKFEQVAEGLKNEEAKMKKKNYADNWACLESQSTKSKTPCVFPFLSSKLAL